MAACSALRAVREIEAEHVDAGRDQRIEHVRRARRGSQRRDNFGVPHRVILCPERPSRRSAARSESKGRIETGHGKHYTATGRGLSGGAAPRSARAARADRSRGPRRGPAPGLSGHRRVAAHAGQGLRRDADPRDRHLHWLFDAVDGHGAASRRRADHHGIRRGARGAGARSFCRRRDMPIASA